MVDRWDFGPSDPNKTRKVCESGEAQQRMRYRFPSGSFRLVRNDFTCPLWATVLRAQSHLCYLDLDQTSDKQEAEKTRKGKSRSLQKPHEA